MTIEQCYQALGGDFRRVSARLPGKGFVERFLPRYLEDDSAQKLLLALSSGDAQEAFRYALALKGVAGNLGLEDLERAAAALVQILHDARGRLSPAALEQAGVVARRHQRAVEILNMYLNEKQI